MIAPITKQEAESLRDRLQSPKDKAELFPDSDFYGTWIKKIGQFFSSKGGSTAFGVEDYRADFEFFTASCEEQMAVLFMTTLAPLELVFFGPDWMVGVSSYPKHAGSRSLKRSVHLYGSAKMEIAGQ